ncbi:hypothetical protein CEXT_621881 [Caerostris extrusa]|uniref:Uncharacterized protein n=1 Tax=Caerostris extrusa TaxID=172846 RepID=A0AAV4N777_CAEEX|nr:hypothetical protein CEXT_621881 [Caerostris extrusa]
MSPRNKRGRFDSTYEEFLQNNDGITSPTSFPKMMRLEINWKCFDKHGNYRLSVEGCEGRKYALTKRHFRWKEPGRWMGTNYPFKRLGIEKEDPFVDVLC